MNTLARIWSMVVVCGLFVGITASVHYDSIGDSRGATGLDLQGEDLIFNDGDGGGNTYISNDDPADGDISIFGDGTLCCYLDESGGEVRFQNYGLRLIPTSRQLILPTSDTAASPGLAFGDGDSGIFEIADDTVSVSIAGSQKYQFGGSFFDVTVTDGPRLAAEATSATNPTLIPNRDQDSTGIGGHASSHIVYLIAESRAPAAAESDGSVSGLDLLDTGTRPTCDSSHRGWVWFDEDASGDTLSMCGYNGTSYGWETIANTFP